MMTRRNFARIEDPHSVKVKLYEVSGYEDLSGTALVCHIRDISEGGISLILNRKLPLKTPMKLRVAIADPPSSFVHYAELRWIEEGAGAGEYNAGLQFIGASETHMEEWRRLLGCVRGTGSTSSDQIRPEVRES